jgi:hypothetical protein
MGYNSYDEGTGYEDCTGFGVGHFAFSVGLINGTGSGGGNPPTTSICCGVNVVGQGRGAGAGCGDGCLDGYGDGKGCENEI